MPQLTNNKIRAQNINNMIRATENHINRMIDRINRLIDAVAGRKTISQQKCNELFYKYKWLSVNAMK